MAGAPPDSLATLFSLFRGCFTRPTFETFCALCGGFIARVGEHAVTGMLVAARLERTWHHSRAHDFFSRSRWSADELGLRLLDFVLARFLPADAPLRLAVDDTIFPAAAPRSSAPTCTDRTTSTGVATVSASLSKNQAGAHPDLTFSFEVKQDPESKPNLFGLKDAYAPTRNIRFELPPGLIGDPNVLGVPQQCTAAELAKGFLAQCPNGSQVGVSRIFAYQLGIVFTEPVYMMQPPGGDVVARLGTIAGLYPTFIDLRVRSEGDYGLVADITEAPTAATLVRVEATNWGVPADSSHDTERMTPLEAFNGAASSPERPPARCRCPSSPTRPAAGCRWRCGSPPRAGPNRSASTPSPPPSRRSAAATNCPSAPV